MYARIKKTSQAPVGAVESHTYRRLAGEDQVTVSLFDTQAAAAADPTAEWYEVEADHPGTGTTEVAAFVHFDGPVSAELKTAWDRASNERIAPAMHGHPGMTRSLVLWQPQRRSAVVISLAESVESIEAGQRKILATDLLPGEDPALLPGADRVELFRAVT